MIIAYAHKIGKFSENTKLTPGLRCKDIFDSNDEVTAWQAEEFRATSVMTATIGPSGRGKGYVAMTGACARDEYQESKVVIFSKKK